VAHGTDRCNILAMLVGGAPPVRLPHPTQPALGDGEQQLTYGELADRLRSGAARIAAAGIGRGDIVGVPNVRTLDTILACLALLARGAAFLPVANPASMPDAVRRTLAAALDAPDDPGWPHGLRRLSLDIARVDGADRDADEPRDGDPAYAMTTSGSTGEQKHTVINRGGLRSMFVALYRNLEHVIPLGARWSQLHPLTFGFSICELLGCFAFAGELVVVPRENPLTLHALLRAVAVSGMPCVVCLTPSELTVLVGALRADPASQPPSHLILSGEPAYKAPLETLAALPGGANLTIINTYAATETSGQITAHVVTADAVPDVLAGLVGPVLPGVSVTLRRDNGTAVAPADHASVGEIWVGGPTLATGYLNAEQTHAHFRRPAPSPDGPTVGFSGPIEYATGDLGRWGPNGLYVLGRVNRTVKLAGQWVSLDELERGVAASSLIDEVAVAPDALADRSDCLRVVVRPNPGAAGRPDHIREHVVRRMPVRITVRLLIVEQLPHLPNGKVDLRTLETLAWPHRPAEPAQGTDGIIRGVWADLLGAGVVPDVNLFELGLDSLGVTVAAARLSSALRREVTPEFLLDHPRIDSQVAALDGHDGARHPPRQPLSGADRAGLRRAVRAEQRSARTAP
jgi:acyl-CoA synthetase (AMP-forming)/AMP-acid ligase II